MFSDKDFYNILISLSYAVLQEFHLDLSIYCMVLMNMKARQRFSVFSSLCENSVLNSCVLMHTHSEATNHPVGQFRVIFLHLH